MLYLEHLLTNFLQTLYRSSYYLFKKERFGIEMGKFCQISTVMALDVCKNFVSGLYFGHLLTNFLLTLYRSLYQEVVGFGIEDG